MCKKIKDGMFHVVPYYGGIASKGKYGAIRWHCTAAHGLPTICDTIFNTWITYNL